MVQSLYHVGDFWSCQERPKNRLVDIVLYYTLNSGVLIKLSMCCGLGSVLFAKYDQEFAEEISNPLEIVWVESVKLVSKYIGCF